MQKQILLFVQIFLFSLFSFSQLNMNLVSHYVYPGNRGDMSDIWGYVDQTGIEYAIVGNQTGTSIVSLADPANPVEVLYSPGANTIWRDMKVWNHTAYITNEGGNGLKIIDLSGLPGSLNAGDVSQYTGSTYPFSTAHNIFIDEVGRAYICGANNGNGGVIILDLTTDPLNPIELGRYNDYYLHDVFVRNDTLWAGAIDNGFFVVLDVSDPANIVTLATHVTPGIFTHQVWLSDDGNTLFTNDEISNGYVAAFDVSDLNNITELDRIQSNPGMNVIPHNTFVLGNYILTSYYRDGVVVHDATYPSNLIEVGNFDTSPSFAGDGFNGCWGVYPYLPSGLIIASDIEEGLYVLGSNLTPGAYLTGTVTDAVTTAPLNNVLVEIVSTTVTDNTDATGQYLTGFATGGTYDVTYSKLGYYSQTITGITLTPGNTTIQDVQLQPMITFSFTGTVVDDANAPIANAQVYIHNSQYETTATTNGLGEFSIAGFLEGDYDITIGHWGYYSLCMENETILSNGGPYVYQLQDGYSDNFDVDLGWSISGNPTTGDFERGIPVGTSFMGGLSNPDADSPDCGVMAYITGNGGGNAGDDDIDNGTTILTSPVFDLSTYNNPYLSFDRWFFNDGGSGTPNDTMTVQITNGSQTVYLDIALANDPDAASWVSKEYKLTDYIPLTAFMQLKVRSMDMTPGHLVEAGFDNFLVVDSSELGIDNVIVNKIIRVYPNPFKNTFTIDLSAYEDQSNMEFELIDAGSGRIIKKSSIEQSILRVDTKAEPGVYFIRILKEGALVATERIVKQ